MEQNKKLINQVNKIMQMHLDRALGYQKARSLAVDDRLKALFESCMQQSYYFAEKLQAAMSLQGMDTHAKPSWSGVMYRGWMTLRAGITQRKDKAIVGCSLTAEKMLDLSYELLCTNKYLQYYFPLLKFTFLKQHFGLKKTREDLEYLLYEVLESRAVQMDVNHSYNQASNGYSKEVSA